MVVVVVAFAEMVIGSGLVDMKKCMDMAVVVVKAGERRECICDVM